MLAPNMGGATRHRPSGIFRVYLALWRQALARVISVPMAFPTSMNVWAATNAIPTAISAQMEKQGLRFPIPFRLIFAEGIRMGRTASTATFPSRSTLRSEEQQSELQSLMRISYAVFCLKKKKKQ